ncbi:MAG: methionyl-tRNA formyltransferase [Actinomycetota bacterium]|nr:methionyl-tRNA formyltransferase [Actinomycetota bacterium]
MFFGTPEWAVPTLAALLESDIEVAAVVTNPDRAAGRGLRDRKSPVKRAALEAGTPVVQPDRVRDADFHRQFVELHPDIAVVVAYGKLLPPDLLAVPALGFVNAHFSLLPAYRGAAPVQWTLINGDRVTGISIMVLTEGMDEGPLLASESVMVDPTDTAATLGQRLAGIAAPLLVDTVLRYRDGLLTPTPQREQGVSLAPKLRSDDVRIDWSRDAIEVHNLIRGANPEPGAWSTFRAKRMKLLASAPVRAEADQPPGHIELVPDGLMVTCGTGTLLLTEAQLEGKRPLPAAELGRGLHLQEGDRFDG